MKIRLREILKERELTLLEFSKKTGITQANLSNYLNGKISPTLDTLSRIADALNIRITELIEEDDDIIFYVKYNNNLINISKEDIITIIKHKIENTNGN